MGAEDGPTAIGPGDRASATDLHRRIELAIDAQVHALTSVAVTTSPGCCSSTSLSISLLLKSLHADRVVLREHWAVEGTPAAWNVGEPASRACGEQQPCQHTLALADRYRVKHR